MTLPGSNATLTAVEQPGGLDRAGRPTAAGTAVWTGTVNGFLERSEQVLEAETARDEPRELWKREHTLTLFAIDGAPLDLVAGPDATAQTIVLEDQRTGVTVARRWTVRGTDLNANGLDADHVVLTISDPRPVA